ncbi:hypothetical protein FOMPIDRAFT_1026493 [Fomitopsis schrenkii]|uniref:Uncharacterized protein n=1 Tax=Fomitopsis schrenkii TaxID=2126942 RepID=S8F3P3_FOMSC|nr:hypothetical protein FOMPIDRAFT_1026493 [Fomitopsis schrenkii]
MANIPCSHAHWHEQPSDDLRSPNPSSATSAGLSPMTEEEGEEDCDQVETSLARSPARSFVRLPARSLVCPLVRPLICLSPRPLACPLVWSLTRPLAHSPVPTIRAGQPYPWREDCHDKSSGWTSKE